MKIFILFSIITCTLSLKGQSTGVSSNYDDTIKKYHHELGLTMYDDPNFEEISTFITLPQAKSIQKVMLNFMLGTFTLDSVFSNPNYKLGSNIKFFYTLHRKYSGFRIGYEFNSMSYNTVVDSTYWGYGTPGWFNIYNGAYNIKKLSLGYEFDFPIEWFQFFYAVDFAYYFGSIKGSIVKGYGDLEGSYTISSENDFNIRLNEFSIAPTVGIRIRIMKVCALTVETDYNYLYCKTKDTKNYYSGSSFNKVYKNPLKLFAISMYL